MNKNSISVVLAIFILIIILVGSSFSFLPINTNDIEEINFGLNSEDDKQKVTSVDSIRDDIGIQQLLDSGYNGSAVTMGIIDSGVNPDPTEFEDRLLDHKSFVNTLFGYSFNDSSVDDDFNHGTRVARLMIGKLSGMAPGANLISAKLFNQTVQGNGGYVEEETSSAIVEAIKWLVDVKNVTVINLSLGQYNNMYNEGREYWINKYSLEKGVIFVISAGNEGFYEENLGSTGNPGTSLQAITVGRSEWTSYSSNGPRYDNALKPDVVAPGTYAGTSFSSPVVAGSVATIISALKANNIDYTPGTVKSALLSTATPIYNNPYRQGTGLINASAAFNLLLTSTKTNSTLPDIITAFPNKLPYFPITTLFTGQRMSFNVTLIASGTFEGIISYSGIPFSFYDIPAQVTMKDTTLLPVSISIPEDALTGNYSGKLIIATNRNAYSIEIDVSFEVRIPKAKILIDFTHSGIINQVLRVIDSLGSLADPWTSSFLWGPYQKFLYCLTENNISVTTSMNQELENITFLNSFDIVLISNPATKLNGTFTDWWNDFQYFPESALTNNVHPFTVNELTTLTNYVDTSGGHLQIFTSYPSMTEINELNNLLNVFNLSYQNDVVKQKMILENISNFLSIDDITIDYIGGTLSSINPEIFEGVFFENPKNTNHTFAYWNSPSNGSVFVSGSSYMLEFGLSDQLTVNNLENFDFYSGLLFQTIAINLTYFQPPITSSIPEPSTTQLPSSNTNPFTNLSTSISSSDILSSANPIETTAEGFLLIFVIAGMLLLRRRSKSKREL
jgi:hypothetical protein